MESLKFQIGGTHYSVLAYQPIALIMKVGFNFIQGNITKYVSRYKLKNGRQDLIKCIHYAKMGIDFKPRNYYAFGEASSNELHRFIQVNEFSQIVEEILFDVAAQNWMSVITKIETLIQTEYE